MPDRHDARTGPARHSSGKRLLERRTSNIERPISNNELALLLIHANPGTPGPSNLFPFENPKIQIPNHISYLLSPISYLTSHIPHRPSNITIICNANQSNQPDKLNQPNQLKLSPIRRLMAAIVDHLPDGVGKFFHAERFLDKAVAAAIDNGGGVSHGISAGQ